MLMMPKNAFRFINTENAILKNYFYDIRKFNTKIKCGYNKQIITQKDLFSVYFLPQLN